MSTQQRSKAATTQSLLWALLGLFLGFMGYIVVLHIHQQDVKPHVVNAHPSAAPAGALAYADSQALHLYSAPYNYTTPAFKADATSAQLSWNCYAAPVSLVAQYDLHMILTDTVSHVQQSVVASCSDTTPPAGNATMQTTPGETYIVTITSAGPWTVEVSDGH